ncbi:MAG: Enoyl-CoA hydratase [Ktedonobacterales bacterium]|jgi:enoyl-CoA hydratase/carnithine racemase|nr:MAG: Enoyl-CoA hydratase [Ktedonobacterales bacterium]
MTATMTTYTTILVQRDAPIATITMNQPERRNALTTPLMRELTDAFKTLGREKDIQAIILAGNGPAFSAGHDLRELVGGNINAYREVFDVCTELMLTIQAIPQPVIAQVRRLATAAGCQLVATCDLAIASEEARFATPGVKIGLFCTTPMVALSRAIGRKRALQMLLTGQPVDAHTAADWGLVNTVVPDAELEEATRALAQSITTASPLTVALGKQAFYSQIDLDQPKAYAYAKEVMTMNAMAADAQEGMCAFLEKRSPTWTGQ